ncbi:MAG TPA: hypothetical protein VE988_17285 [Gemmataceae bacterium]|nr:hypothetical protein [Gemmataceae bacterium]
MRTLRTIVILEAIGNAEALQMLRELAGGAKGSRVTEAAQASLTRLEAKHKMIGGAP